MDTYFWIEKYADGSISFRLLSHGECESLVNERVRAKKVPPYLSTNFPKYLNDMRVGHVIIIGGNPIHPVPIQEVMRYEVPL